VPLFEVAILENPTRKAAEDGASQKLVFGPQAVVARDAQSAAINAVLDGAELSKDVDRSRLEVLVRPFA
jgi:hypothetical protein